VLGRVSRWARAQPIKRARRIFRQLAPWSRGGKPSVTAPPVLSFPIPFPLCACPQDRKALPTKVNNCLIYAASIERSPALLCRGSGNHLRRDSSNPTYSLYSRSRSSLASRSLDADYLRNTSATALSDSRQIPCLTHPSK
jgi:hypothetical protein